MTVQTDTELTRVAGELYGALMDARRYVDMWTSGQLASVSPNSGTRAMRVLDRCDAALADAADYLSGKS